MDLLTWNLCERRILLSLSRIISSRNGRVPLCLDFECVSLNLPHLMHSVNVSERATEVNIVGESLKWTTRMQRFAFMISSRSVN